MAMTRFGGMPPSSSAWPFVRCHCPAIWTEAGRVRERLLDLISARLARYEHRHDATDILDDALRATTFELLEFPGSRTTDLAALLAAARVFWLRYLLLPEGQDEPDLEQALTLYRVINKILPEAVPDELREEVSPGPHPADPDSNVAIEQVYPRLIAYFAAAVERADGRKIYACVEGFRQILRMLPPAHPRRAEVVSTLAVAYGSLYNFTTDPADLDNRITILQFTVAAAGLPVAIQPGLMAAGSQGPSVNS